MIHYRYLLLFLVVLAGACWGNDTTLRVVAVNRTGQTLRQYPLTITNGLVEVEPSRWGQYFASLALRTEGRRLPFFAYADTGLPFATKPLAVVENGPLRWRLEAGGVDEPHKLTWRKRVTLYAGSADICCEFTLRNNADTIYTPGQMTVFHFLPAPGGQLCTNHNEFGNDQLWYWKDGKKLLSPLSPKLGRTSVYWDAGTAFGVEDTACDAANRGVAITTRIPYPLQTILYNLGSGKSTEEAMHFSQLLLQHEAGDYPALPPAQELTGTLWLRPLGKDAGVIAPVFPTSDDVEVTVFESR